MRKYTPEYKNGRVTILPLLILLLLSLSFFAGCDLINSGAGGEVEANRAGDEKENVTGVEVFKIEPTVEPDFVFVAIENINQDGKIFPTYQVQIVVPQQITLVPYQPAPKVVVPPNYQPPLVPQPLSQPPGLPYHQPIYQPPISQPILPPSFNP